MNASLLISDGWMLSAVLRVTGLLTAVLLAWRGLPASRPRLRRGVALAGAGAALCALVPAGLWEVAVPLARAPRGGAWPGAESADHAAGFGWTGALAAVWLGGTVVAVCRWCLQAWKLRRLVKTSRSFRRGCRGDCGKRGEFAVFHDVRLSPVLSGPCVAGTWRPVLLVPAAARRWTADEWRMVLAHECQHLRQRDLLAGWLPRLVAAVYWWHPLAHWIHRQYHLESEALCDRAVLSGGRAVRPYVEFLLALSSRATPRLATAMARASRLGQRLERLLAVPEGERCSRRGPSMVALLLLSAALGVVALRITTPPAGPAARHEPEADRAMEAEAMLRLSANPFPQP